MSGCKHGNLWCNGTVKFSTTGPCLQCLRELFKERDQLRDEKATLEGRCDCVGRRGLEQEIARLKNEIEGLKSDAQAAEHGL